MYQDIKPLGLQGSRGALFRLVLTSFGYTFVAKGTVSHYVPYLLHEAFCYEVLDKLQGDAVPVYLGNIDLIRPYYLDLDVDIVHMLLMSWGGEGVDKVEVPDLDAETKRTLQEVLKTGMEHGDVRPANMLWNTERRRVMLIDFDRSTRVPFHRRISELAGRKKKRDVRLGPHSHARVRSGRTRNEKNLNRATRE
jgi:hypothetical protein